MTATSLGNLTSLRLCYMPGPPHKYQQIAEDLRAGIRAGRYEPGDRLPSVAELKAAYGVALGTVTKAIGLLENEGIAYSEQGRGTFVSDPPPEEARSELDRMRASIEELSEKVRQLDGRLTAHEEQSPVRDRQGEDIE